MPMNLIVMHKGQKVKVQLTGLVLTPPDYMEREDREDFDGKVVEASLVEDVSVDAHNHRLPLKVKWGGFTGLAAYPPQEVID